MQHLESLAGHRLAWHMALSEEDKAKVVTAHSEENKEARMASFVATFQSSDTNGDGLLQKAEFADFFKKLSQNAGAAGVPHMTEADTTEEQREQVWEMYNSQTAGTDGVSMADFGAVTEIFKAKLAELRAAM